MIDAHVHLWDPARHDYPWLADQTALRRAFQPDDFDADADTHEVAGVVVIEAGARPDQAMAELAWIEELATRWPAIQGFVAHAPVDRGRAVTPWLAQLTTHQLVRGVRRIAQDEPPGFLTSAEFVAGVAGLAAFDLPFDACIRQHQLSELTQLVDRCPEVTFVLDHLGKPEIRQQRHQPWSDELAALANRDNVYVKLSGLATEAGGHDWRPADLIDYLRHALAVFGPHRCLFGSDWPVATEATDYGRWVEVVCDALAGQPAAEVFTDNAARVYKLAQTSDGYQHPSQPP